MAEGALKQESRAQLKVPTVQCAPEPAAMLLWVHSLIPRVSCVTDQLLHAWHSGPLWERKKTIREGETHTEVPGVRSHTTVLCPLPLEEEMC